MKIYAKNRVSELAKRRHGIKANLGEITVRTNWSYQSVSGLNKISLKFLFICLSFVYCAHVASDGATSRSDAFRILLAKIIGNQYESKKGSERAFTIVLNFLRCLSSQFKFLTDLDKTIIFDAICEKKNLDKSRSNTLIESQFCVRVKLTFTRQMSLNMPFWLLVSPLLVFPFLHNVVNTISKTTVSHCHNCDMNSFDTYDFFLASSL